MAAPNSSNVSAMKPLSTGGVLVAPFGTDLPPEEVPSGSVTIDEAFVALGYMEQDAGVTNAEEANIEEQNAWGGDLVMTVSATRKETYAFKAIEQNLEAWKLRYGSSNVKGTTTANAVVVHDGSAYDELVSIIIAEKLMDGRVHLSAIPKAKLESADDVEHSDSSALGYGMTFTALSYEGKKTSYDIYYTPAP